MRKNWLIQNMAARFVHSNCNLGRFAVVAVFLVLLSFGNGWGVCQERWISLILDNQCGVQNKFDGEYCSGESVSATYCCQQSGSVANNYKVTLSGASPTCQWHLVALRSRQDGSCCSNGFSCNYPATLVRCDEPCESDSVKCISDGGTWTNTGASTCDGKSCKMSNCLQSDTLWLNASKAACDAIGGENNYAIADIDETCVHSGICCPPDSALVGNTCKWRCDSLYTSCTAKNGYLYAAVLQDTTISGEDSIFTNTCYYNCSYAYNKDSTTSVTDGNTACSSPSTPIAECTRMPNDFASVRTIYGDSVYSYDFLTPGSASYIDSIVLTPCSRFMYRCTVSGKYKYWYSDADIPAGCTNIVKIK